jgi:nitronate monooxygenase
VDADAHEDEDFGLLQLLALVGARVDVTLIAAGGIATGGGVAGVLAAGATAAALAAARDEARGRITPAT